jgi:hypothetical protein
MIRRLARPIAALAVLLIAGCGPSADGEGPLLHEGARVRFQAARGGDGWTTAMVGRAGNCMALMVPDSWSEPRRFQVVLVDSVAALERSTRYDGVDETRRATAWPPDTAGEGWTALPMDRIRRLHGGCDPVR